MGFGLSATCGLGLSESIKRRRTTGLLVLVFSWDFFNIARILLQVSVEKMASLYPRVTWLFFFFLSIFICLVVIMYKQLIKHLSVSLFFVSKVRSHSVFIQPSVFSQRRRPSISVTGNLPGLISQLFLTRSRCTCCSNSFVWLDPNSIIIQSWITNQKSILKSSKWTLKVLL